MGLTIKIIPNKTTPKTNTAATKIKAISLLIINAIINEAINISGARTQIRIII